MDGRPLQGYTNHQAVELLRSTGKVCIVFSVSSQKELILWGPDVRYFVSKMAF